MANLKQTTDTHSNTIGTFHDYTQKENGKRQKRVAHDNDFDSDMEDMKDSDALGVKIEMPWPQATKAREALNAT
eukprot:7212273-Ditylum_brightwellii.AAC.1